MIGIREGKIVFDGPAKGTEWDKVLDSIYVGKVDREGNIQEEG